MRDRLAASPAEGDFCGLELTHPHFPQHRVRMRLPEGIVFYDEGGAFAILMCGHTPTDWSRAHDGTLSHRRTLDDTFEYQVFAKPSGDTLHLRATVTNVSSRALTRIEFSPCIQLAAAPHLKDPALNRTFYHADGALLSVADARRPNDPTKVQLSVTADLGFRWTLSDAEQHYGWGLASPDADAAFIATVAADAKGAIATWWQTGATLCTNVNPDSAIFCIHAEPYIGTLAPGQSRTLTGQLVWSADASIDALWARWRRFRREPLTEQRWWSKKGG